jgi:LCP family protein required for cell wall assembly
MESIALDMDAPNTPDIDSSTSSGADSVDGPDTSETAPLTASEPDAPTPSDADSPATKRRGWSPALAAFLSFLWPGLGQLYLRNRRLAAIFAVPSLFVVLLLAYALRRGPVVLAAQLFADRGVGLVTVAIILLFGAWRIASVVQAFLVGHMGSTHKVVNTAVLVALAAIIAVTHLGGGYYLLAYSDAGTQVFNPGDTRLIVQATPAPSLAPGQTAGPLGTPEPLPTVAGDGRVTILFTGTSSGASSNLYDSIMVVSYDPQANSIQMVSVPRDSASFPFYFGGVDDPSHKINALPTYVASGHIKSPDAPYTTLIKEVQFLVGVSINYYAVMDIGGFETMINKVGGIDVVNPYPIDDPSYDWLDGSPYGFSLSAGPHHLDGRAAMAFVRSRHGVGDSDWKRASRQQLVLVALLHKMAQPSEILKLPSLISTLGASVTTDFPADKVGDFVALGQDVPSANISQVVLGPPYTITGISTVNAANCLLNDKVAALSVQLFGKDSLWSGQPAPANTCP